MENRGKLLVSTKTSGGMKTFQLVSNILMLCLGIFFLLNSGIFGDMGEDMLGNKTIGIVLGWFLVIMPFTYPVFTIIGNRSYCDVYENTVTGMTGLSLSNPNAPMQKFDIGYDEIMNVTESGKTIFLHTSYMTYEVLAMSHRSDAVKEIRKRMTGKK